MFGDIIISFNGEDIVFFNDLFFELEKYKLGDVIFLEVEREDWVWEFELELGELE